jgi:periplasmic protein TonB
MSGQRRAFACSVGIHLVGCMLLFGAIRWTTPERKLLIIDFGIENQQRAAQSAQLSSGTESTPEAAGVHRPIPAKSVRRGLPPARDVIREPPPQIQPMAAVESQVAVTTPEPTRSAAPDSGTGAPTSALNSEMAGTDAGIPGSGGNSGSDGSTSSGPGASPHPGMAGPGAGGPGLGDGHGSAGSASASGSGTDAERPVMRYMKAHFAAIRNAIMSKLSYPPLARRMGWTGTVKMSFVVTEDGHVNNIKVLATSGHETLDNNAVEAIRRGSPYPKPPVMAELLMPITYRLNE